jgi:adenosylcobyric acid synthase
MGFARRVDAPVVLVGDIDRGGVIAQLVGCKAVLDPDDEALIRGFIVNKFRGDPSLFDEGMRFIASRPFSPTPRVCRRRTLSACAPAPRAGRAV